MLVLVVALTVWSVLAAALAATCWVVVLRHRRPAEVERQPFWDEAMRELDVLDGTTVPTLPCLHRRVVLDQVDVFAYGTRPIRSFTRRCVDCGERLPENEPSERST